MCVVQLKACKHDGLSSITYTVSVLNFLYYVRLFMVASRLSKIYDIIGIV